MALLAREQYGATLVPVRTAEGGGLEVLLGQNPVVDFIKSTSATGPGVSIRRYPGELRFLGSRAALDEDSTPLDTAVRDLTPSGWPEMLATIVSILSARPDAASAVFDVRPALFSVSERLQDECFRVYCFVCAVGGPFPNDSLSRALDKQIQCQLEACEAYGDEFFKLSAEARAALAPKLRKLEWRKVSEVLEETRPDRPFINDWQRDMFRRHGLSCRQIAWATVQTLEKLSRYSSAEEVVQAARNYEQQIRSSLVIRSAPDIAVCLPNLEELVLLSYNLNVLPWCAHRLGSGQGVASGKRLDAFLQGLESQPPEKRPDILAIQELFSTPFLPVFCAQREFVKSMARLGYSAVTSRGHSLMSWSSRRKWTDSGLLIFTRLPVAARGALEFSACAGWDAWASKGAIWARVRLAPGKFLDVFNCHLQATHTTDCNSEVVRREQLVSLRTFIREHAGGQPCVLTGDFNVDAIAELDDPRGAFGYALRPPCAESSDYRSMLRVLDPNDEMVDLLLLSTSGSHKVGLRGHPCTRPPRQHFPKTASYTMKHKHKQRLDYVFFRPTMSSLVEHVHSEVEEFKVAGHQGFTYLSDHWGIRSHFRIKCGFAWKYARTDVEGVVPESDEVATGKGLRAFSFSWLVAVLLLAALARWCDSVQGFCIGLFAIIMLSVAMDVGTFFERGSARAATDQEGRKKEGARPAPMQANNPYDAFARSVPRHCFRSCLGARATDANGSPGEYQWLTYEQVHRKVLLLASGLQHEFEVKSSSKVGLLGDACVEWMLAELALMQCGVQTTCLLNLEGLGRDASGVHCVDLLLCSEVWVEHILDRELDLGAPIVSFEPVSARMRARAKARGLHLVDLAYCSELADVEGPISQGYSAAWATFTRMPCWGSTDSEPESPSFVLVSMQQLAQKAATVASQLGLLAADVHFSYQSPAWIGERILLHAILAAGGSIGFFRGVRSPRVFEDIRTLRPTFLTGTPNVFCDQLRQLQETQGHWLGLVSRICFLVQAAFLDRGRRSPHVLDVLLRRVRSTVFGSVRPRFILILCTPTQACMRHELCRWLRTFGACPVLKALVVAEAVGFVTLGEAPYRGGSVKNFAVGQALPYVDQSIQAVSGLGISPSDLRCDELGRMVINGPSVVLGGTRPEPDQDRLDDRAERQVHGGATTDVLVGRRGATIFVFGRLSSAATLPNGGRVLLEAMEQLCTQHAGQWLSQLFLTEKGGVLSGIAAVQPEHLWRAALRHSLCRGEDMAAEELCRNEAVRAWCLEDLRRSCCGLDLGLPLRRLSLVVEPFCCENGLQTPTFQLRRKSLERKFADFLGTAPEALLSG